MSTVSCVDPYESLGNAVVLQAVRDCREATKKLSRGRRNPEAEKMKMECERFFNSQHFNVFTNLDGRAILSQLEKEVLA